MPREFSDLKDGDPLPGPDTFNAIYRELARLRRTKGSGGLVVEQGEGGPVVRSIVPPRIWARLTGAYSSGYPWASLDGTITGSAASGDPAFERRTGDTTLGTSTTIYEMVRSPASNQWVFPHYTAPVSRHLTFFGKDCGGSAIPGAVATVTGPGGFSASCTLAMVSGNATCVVGIPGVGSYPWTITHSSGTCTGTAVFTTPTLAATASCCIGPNLGKICGTLRHDCGPIAGVTVQAIRSGSVVATTTSDASGNFCLCAPATGLNVTISIPAFGRYGLTQVSVPGSFFGACNTYSVGTIVLKCAAGYAYFSCCSCPGPKPSPLTLNDSVYGVVSLTASSTGTASTSVLWSGQLFVDYPGCGGCGAISGLRVTYNAGACGIQIQASRAGFSSCPGNDGGAITYNDVTLSVSCPLNGTGATSGGVYCAPATLTLTE